MRCTFCLRDKKKLVKAHVIPRCFYEKMRISRNEPFQALTNTAGRYPTKSRIGIYDPQILCDDCEKMFQKYDDYACRLLLSDFTESNFVLDPSGNKIGYWLNGIDYQKLKLFFLSVLWRASVSKREEFKRVRIGSFEAEIREMIKNSDPDRKSTRLNSSHLY